MSAGITSRRTSSWSTSNAARWRTDSPAVRCRRRSGANQRSSRHALVHAHSGSILHCDIKPANILLDAHQEPRLGDFGQSRLTTEQSPALGTFFYMAPEQAVLQGAPDVCWDVYALGAVLYEMLTGAPPYETPYHSQQLSQATTLDDRLQAYRRIVMRSQRPVGHEQLPGRRPARAIIDQCLERDPVKRTPSAQAVLDAAPERRRQSRAKRPLIAARLGPIDAAPGHHTGSRDGRAADRRRGRAASSILCPRQRRRHRRDSR
ncbi:MAG: protein kinase [Planctomycetaceae bacterium]